MIIHAGQFYTLPPTIERDGAVVGNGVNDRQALAAAVLGVAVLGPEGASSRALLVADVVCATIIDALDLLLGPRALTATLRP
ncbi:hypothetical protein ACIBI9_59975 [Nonomuraea sp. NPDC050451]|uniref:hypothetical protein n=1 Tax=Nonomuraea sp. NPDC050451 TaxID=3364364 RepID=UPI00378AF115